MKRLARLWGIRHVRFTFCAWRVRRHARAWARAGIGLGIPNPTDLDHLDAIWRGEA